MYYYQGILILPSSYPANHNEWYEKEKMTFFSLFCHQFDLDMESAFQKNYFKDNDPNFEKKYKFFVQNLLEDQEYMQKFGIRFKSFWNRIFHDQNKKNQGFYYVYAGDPTFSTSVSENVNFTDFLFFHKGLPSNEPDLKPKFQQISSIFRNIKDPIKEIKLILKKTLDESNDILWDHVLNSLIVYAKLGKIEQYQPTLNSLLYFQEYVREYKIYDYYNEEMGKIHQLTIRQVSISSEEREAFEDLQERIGRDIPFQGHQELWYERKDRVYAVCDVTGFENGEIQSHIIYLSLQGINLTEFPEEIYKFPMLKNLSLRNNQIIDIPETPSPPLNLEIFDLANNKINSFPSWIFKLRNLKRFEIYRNPLINEPTFQFYLDSFDGYSSMNEDPHVEFIKDVYAFSFRNKEYYIKKLKSGNEWDRWDLTNPALNTFKNELLIEIQKMSPNEDSSHIKALKDVLDLELIEAFPFASYIIPEEKQALESLVNQISREIKIFNAAVPSFDYPLVGEYERWGIVISEDHHVIQLNLSGAGLKEVPKEFLQFTKLFEIDLSNNKLTDLPRWFKNLSFVDNVYLAENNFKRYPRVLGFFEDNNRHQWILEGIDCEENLDFLHDYDGYETLYYLRTQFYMEEWNVHDFIERVKKGEKIQEADKIHPDLLKFTDQILHALTGFESAMKDQVFSIIHDREVLVQLENEWQIEIPYRYDYDFQHFDEWYDNFDHLECGYSWNGDKIGRISVDRQRITRIPRILTKLNGLTFFSAIENQISKFPTGLKFLPNLRILNLRLNPISCFPLKFYLESNVCELYLSSDHFTPYEQKIIRDIEEGVNILVHKQKLIDQIENWNVNELISRLKQNQMMTPLDKIVPDLLKFGDFIEKKCKNVENNAVLDAIQFITELRKIKISESDTNIFL